VSLALIHFLLKCLQDCARRPGDWPYYYFVGKSPSPSPDPGGTAIGEAEVADGGLVGEEHLHRHVVRLRRNFLPRAASNKQELPLFMVAKIDGNGFANFVVLSVLEALLSVTNTLNTTLEGDFDFTNDPNRVAERTAWAMCLTNVALLLLFTCQMRVLRVRAKPRLSKAKLDARRDRLVELMTWAALLFSFVHVTVSAIATASNVSSNHTTECGRRCWSTRSRWAPSCLPSCTRSTSGATRTRNTRARGRTRARRARRRRPASRHRWIPQPQEIWRRFKLESGSR